MIVSPIINREEALSVFRGRKGLLFRRRQVVKVELWFMPYDRFVVELETGREPVKDACCVDRVVGAFAFIDVERLKMETETPDAGLRAHPALSPQQTLVIAQDEYARHLLRLNLRRKTSTRVTAITHAGVFEYPYWVGYFTKGRVLDFDVIDAVSGQFQGPKMRPVFAHALLSA